MTDDEDPSGLARPWRTLKRIRQTAPQVHVISNFVAADFTANLLLASGATVAMAQRGQEVEDFVALAHALCINLGTLSNEAIDPMAEAAYAAVGGGKPWVLDPVAVAANEDRRNIAKRLAGLQPTVIRGNAAEVLSLGGGSSAMKTAVDTGIEPAEALDAAHDLAKTTGALVAVTGTVDYVTDGERLAAIANGHALMSRVTGVGCGLSAFMAACCAVEEDPLIGAAHGLAIIGVAGEIAGEKADGPGSFRMHLIDVLDNLDERTLDAAARIQ